MASWMLSTSRKEARQFFFRKQSGVHYLLRALNQQIQEASGATALLESIAATVRRALNPTDCLIWLRQNPFEPDKHIPAWIGFRPPAGLANRNYQPCVQPGVLPVAGLEDSLARVALLEANMNIVTLINYRKEVIGWLGVGPPRRGQIYSAAERTFLEVLAFQSAVTIHNLRLQIKLESSVTQLRRAYQQIIQAQEKERCQLAGTLHDETLQHLADLSVRLGLLRSQSQITPADLDDLQTRLAGADRRLREVVRGVHPAVLSDLGLVEAVIAFLETVPFNHVRAAIEPVRIELHVTGFNEQRLPDQNLELALYRFIQNATANALAHGKPSHIKIEFNWNLDSVEVRVTDDGCGMDTTVEEAARAGHFGLLTMRERVETFDGRFVLVSRPGQGTQVTGCVPLTALSPAPGQVDIYTFAPI